MPITQARLKAVIDAGRNGIEALCVSIDAATRLLDRPQPDIPAALALLLNPRYMVLEELHLLDLELAVHRLTRQRNERRRKRRQEAAEQQPPDFAPDEEIG